ncbi:TetR/AcrR family transcriptional regulator [Desulfonema ishimotonii]|uniref:TetR/AcrR family transcriptional regulator n=2 Tax=Desulfonema ishimotonii TaxID=45657 RepID=A0A401FZB2_9BACT|nr:TetR/AcrR family transcriptional regulator [Desulfonema ishimotonii]
MNYAAFQKQMNITRKSICREIYSRNRESIRIKKEETVIRNLEKIFSAALKISNQKGFQAMSMRDLSRETGLSTGALYAYFSSKEDLLNMMQHQQRTIVRRILEECATPEAGVAQRLRGVIRTHLYLSEAMQPWFYFSYMEAKNLSKAQRDMAVAGSRIIENVISNIIRDGQESGCFGKHDHLMSASLIKAMLQDWYLNRRKYARRSVSVDKYADFVLAFAMKFLDSGENQPQQADAV